jgi:hypothetical protein
MSHRYAVGDLVMGRSLAVPPGPYLIVRLLPPVASEPHYHGRSTVDGHHRALLEGQIRAVVESAPASVLAKVEVQPRRQRRALR